MNRALVTHAKGDSSLISPLDLSYSCFSLVAVEEPQASYSSQETLFFTIYPYYSNLVQVP